mmetsp:Transcript_41151/g.96540  ORF Transcript_41151/g.96540 Transcript_41151/m.96540 type:complete len:323 (-) Transcript_41151:19-987(-)
MRPSTEASTYIATGGNLDHSIFVEKTVSLNAPFRGKTYCMIHVGKTAGTKLTCELRYELGYKRYQCKHKFPLSPPNSALAKHRGGRVHIDQHHGNCLDDNIFLVSLRNPLERLISWYYFEHLQNEYEWLLEKLDKEACHFRFHNYKEWNGCFSTINEFSQACLPNATEGSCSNLAWDVARGSVACQFHNIYNYRYYLEIMDMYIKKKKWHDGGSYSLVVIRQEHLEEDFSKLNVLFGDKSTSSFVDSRETESIAKQKFNKRKLQREPLSKEGRYNLCRALSDEINIYISILDKAENLDISQREESMKELYNSCPKEILDLSE